MPIECDIICIIQKSFIMKNIRSILIIVCICILISFTCEKDNSKTINGSCLKGEIIEVTCGGTVVQILSVKKIGENWGNYFQKPSVNYENSVLIGNVPQDKIKGDTIYFNFKNVAQFSNGNFCDIGGLPDTKIEILNLVTKNCADNETL